MDSYLKSVFILCLAFILSNCTDSQRLKKKEIYFYYLSCYQGVPLSADTLTYEEVNHVTPTDELIATEYFKYKEKYHVIKFYSSENTAPVDGGRLAYTLDSLGIIYHRAVWWPNFGRLSSNNDSINDLISTAFGYIMMKPSLRCYYCSDKHTHIPEEKKAPK